MNSECITAVALRNTSTLIMVKKCVNYIDSKYICLLYREISGFDFLR